MTKNEDYLAHMQAKRTMLPEFFRECAIPFCYLGAIGAYNTSGANLYSDYCHLTPAGSELVADRMHTVLYPRIKATLTAHTIN